MQGLEHQDGRPEISEAQTHLIPPQASMTPAWAAPNTDPAEDIAEQEDASTSSTLTSSASEEDASAAMHQLNQVSLHQHGTWPHVQI